MLNIATPCYMKLKNSHCTNNKKTNFSEGILITSELTKNKNKTFKLGKTENVCRGRRIADNLTADAEVREGDTGTQTLYIGNVVISQIYNIYISAKVFRCASISRLYPRQ